MRSRQAGPIRRQAALKQQLTMRFQPTALRAAAKLNL